MHLWVVYTVNIVGSTMCDRANQLVDDWLALDFCESTRTAACRTLLEGKFEEIEARLSGKKKLVFGTAGLRAALGFGFDRMNTVTVMQTTQGLLNCLEQPGDVDVGQKGSVVVGFDGRHCSEDFAHVVASVFLSRGYVVKFLEHPSPTPFTPFLVAQTGALCGVQITASHNPKNDNGYKLFWANGAQIVPPIDAQVARSIEDNRSIWLDVFSVLDAKTCRIKTPSPNLHNVYESTLESYCDVLSRDLHRPLAGDHTYKFCYTAMHGVGFTAFEKLFHAFGLNPSESLLPVPSQQCIDPEFPTVPFPNPEEKGALKLAIAYAEENACKMVLANDPDADRFTAAEKQPDGSWYHFTGDELGLLFADWMIEGNKDRQGLIVSSVVSSRMVEALCRVRENCRYEDCLTGFKWIANHSISARKKNSHLKHLLGYEEAIGYQLSPIVPDKDGLTAGCAWAQMTLFWQAHANLTMKARLEKIQRTEIGYFVTNNGYYVSKDPDVTRKIFADFRHDDIKKISHLGDLSITRIRDVTHGKDTTGDNGLPVTPDAEMITLFFENGAAVTIRASGTEPKVKYYSEMSSKVSADDARNKLNAVVETIKREFYKPHINTSLEPQPSM